MTTLLFIVHITKGGGDPSDIQPYVTFAAAAMLLSAAGGVTITEFPTHVRTYIMKMYYHRVEIIGGITKHGQIWQIVGTLPQFSPLNL